VTKRLRRFLSRWQNVLGIAIVLGYVLAAMAAPWLAPPDDPAHPTPFRSVGRITDHAPKPPSREAPLGTVGSQFDIYYTLVWGTRTALRFGLTIALSTAVLGILIGAVSGYRGGLLNGFLMRTTDAFLTFPTIAGVWLFRELMPLPGYGTEPALLQRVMSALSLDPVMITLILFSWMAYARLINVNISQLKQSEYVTAARSIGAGDLRIIFRHLLPNALAPAIVLVARDIGAMVILESAFTFIGLGGSTEWGTLLVMGRDYVIGMGGNPLAYWWTFLPASLALAFFGISWNLLGDGLNDMLDPRSAR
jgi:peptide/nickel transport system permease protein